MGRSFIEMKYKRGDIVIVNFPFSDLSKAKKRPALIISNHLVNRTGDYLLVQISSKIRADDLSQVIEDSDFQNNKQLPLQSCIRIHKIFTLNEDIILAKYSSLKEDFLENVINKIVTLIR
jgi:mRNA interferase MazF